MANCFVTGASGFIGQHLVKRLIEEGMNPVCLARQDHQMAGNHGGTEWVRGDLNHPHQYADNLRNVDFVIHLAGLITARRREDYYRTNVEGTRKLLEICRANAPSLKRFVLVSSIAALGPSSENILLSEEYVPRPETEYGRSKLLAEREVLKHASNIPTVILRPTFVYGPGDMRGLKSLKLLSEQDRLISFSLIETACLCYVTDLAAVCVRSLTEPNASGKIFHIADPEVYTLRQINETLKQVILELYSDPPTSNFIFKRIIDSSPELNSRSGCGQGRKYWGCSIEKAKRELHFDPRYNLLEGARETISWYRDHNLYDLSQESKAIVRK